MRMCFLVFAMEIWGRRSSGGSVEIAGFEGRVGLVDDLQFLLGGLVAAMGVRVVLLDQHLVARLQAQRGELGFDIEYREGLRAGRGDSRRSFAPAAPGMTARM